MTHGRKTAEKTGHGGRNGLALLVAVGLALGLGAAPPAGAGTVFADRVVSVAGKPMENFEGVEMTPDTYWWLTGASDDVVSGWRSEGPATELVMGFPIALLDGPGPDLRIRCYGPGPYTVEAGTDGTEFTLIGECATGTPGVFEGVEFDFAGLVDDVAFVRIKRTATGPRTGRFFDSFEGLHPTPEPATLALLAVGGLAVLHRKR